jgi:hypothetical protein
VYFFLLAVVGAASLGFDVLGYDPKIESASWCWIAPTTKNQIVWNFMTGKVWELLAYFLTCVLYTAVRISLLRQKVRDVKFNLIQSYKKIGVGSNGDFYLRGT